jgi:uncharacterized membrane protein
VGFFTGITSLIGVILAYVNRDEAQAPYRSHFAWQIRIFWRGMIFGVVNTLLYVLASIVTAFTVGFGVFLMFLPLAGFLWWLVWTIRAIVKGMKALGRGEAAPF